MAQARAGRAGSRPDLGPVLSQVVVAGTASPLFAPGRVGSLEVPNRIIRSSTSETMATSDGEATDALVELYARLARGGVGLIFAGQMFCEVRGRAGFAQTGIHADAMVPGLRGLVDGVHAEGGRIFAQLAHAGSQSVAPDLPLVAPSPGQSWVTGRTAEAAPEAVLDEVVEAYGRAAERAVTAGFDGVHVHAANGYLLSTFQSPLSNTRTDRLGGTPEGRSELTVAVVRRIREAVPADFPVSIKLGLVDEMDDGLTLEESLPRAVALVAAGVDAIEVSSNQAMGYDFSCRPYAGVTRRQAAADILVHRLLSKPRPEAYFRPLAARLRAAVDVPVVLTGGLRRRQTMESVLGSGDADFVGMGRPFIRQPDLVRRLAGPEVEPAACTSCNICVMHDEYHPLRCWRHPRRNLAEHAIFRLKGGFK